MGGYSFLWQIESAEEIKPVVSVSPFQRDALNSNHRSSFRSTKLDSPKLTRKTQFNNKEFNGIANQKEYDVGLLRRGSVRIKRAFRYEIV